MPRTRALPLLAAAVLPALLVACGGTGSTEADGTEVQVTSTDTACDVSTTTVPAGTVTFVVGNEGGAATEFYVLSSDGESVVAEVEDIGPDLSRELTVDLAAGAYVTRCKPGMTGDGIDGELTVDATG
jgi:iron uptake system component EfeO